MLKKDFLGKLSRFVTASLLEHGDTMDKEFAFFLGSRHNHVMIEHRTDDRVIGLFSEWLVFDRKHKLFGNITGLEYFIQQYKNLLTDEEFSAYKDLLMFEVGLFTLTRKEVGKGVTLLSLQSNTTFFVHDISASFSAEENTTVWARIASVEGLYNVVGSALFVLPITIRSGLRKAMNSWSKNIYDAKEICDRLLDSPRDVVEKYTSNQSYQHARETFEKALADAKMDTIFSVKTFEKWLTNEKRYSLGFASKALVCLMPSDVSDKNFTTVVNAAMFFSNLVPRKSLNGKSPEQSSIDNASKEKSVYDVDIISKEKYIEILESSHSLMAQGDFKGAYDSFENLIRILLEDQVPFFDTFRIFCNAGIVRFHDRHENDNGDPYFAQQLINAAIRINPQYAFAVKTKEELFKQFNDFSNIKKGFKRIAKDLNALLENAATKKYRRSTFYKYEQFLSKVGVSLDYLATVVPTIYSTSGGGHEIKLGRNDPCYCGSGKKYKKCHGF